LTEELLKNFSPSEPYLTSEVALYGPADVVPTYLSRTALQQVDNLRLLAFNEVGLLAGLKQRLPDADVTVVSMYQDPPDFSDTQAALWSLVPARAIARSHDGIAVAVPDHMGNDFIFVYYMSQNSPRLRIIVNEVLIYLKATGWYDL
jgi:hypothetical protein